ncbi:MAG: DUF6494 family protein [Candidatus Competibacteraceae bacterium]
MKNTRGKTDESDFFNIELRKFLKKVVTSQREIENAVRDASDKGDLKERCKRLAVRMTLTIDKKWG